MTRITGYFSTDWASMTATDWFGALFTLLGLALMVWAYYYAFSPGRREKFKKDGNIPMNDEPEHKSKGV